MSGFKKAVKTAAKLRMALAGPAGSGKTFTALTLATALADGRPVAVIDTERGSASKYADLFAFDVMELEPPYHPDRYMAAIREAEAAGYAVLVIDSLTHAWNGAGGLLEVHEQIVKRQTTKNSYTAWAEVTPIQNRFIDSITSANLHIIATMRAKSEYLQGEDKSGRRTIAKVGTAAIQRDGMEFEFDIYGQMDLANTLIIEKTRCPALSGAVIDKPGAQMAGTLRTWLSGEEPAEPPAITAAQPAHATTTPQHTRSKTPESPTFGSLRLRGLRAGITSMEAWEDVCQEIAGAVKPEDMSDEGKRNLRAYVEDLERKKAARTPADAAVDAGATEDASADFPAPDASNGHDLRGLVVPGTRH